MRVRMLSVYCILEVKYCITGVNVYMDMNFVDKNLTDLSYLTAFFCIVNLKVSHCKREKKVSDYFGRNDVHFPNIILCVCVDEGVCV